MNDRTKQRLKQILMFAARIRRVMSTTSLETFLSDVDIQDSVLYRLGQIGEAASKIPDDEQEKYPAIFWDGMIGLRHRLFHEYYEIDLSRVYDVTQEPIAQLVNNLEKILSGEL